mmetsp:Transcript_2683/g.2338  ORF Transcript_2683/g.2338 Transcript_2683/m.2338 type:complete len:130 (+) Transcript_2683:156-545(+)
MITQIKAKGHNSLVITKLGKSYYWPMVAPSGEIIPRPVELSLPYKCQIVTASLGYNFAMLVSKSGHVFSFGKDNSVGQLGHGDTEARLIPTMIEGLRNEKVVSISCGYKHTICKTGLGKTYTWGWGGRG